MVKQPTGLQLPTQPATAALTILRIVGTDGKTRKTCSAPAPVGTSGAALDDYDWWFTDGNDLNNQVPQTRQPLHLHQPRRSSAARPTPARPTRPTTSAWCRPGGCDTPIDCEVALGVRKTPWICQKEAGALPATRGTCLCGS